MTPEAGGEFIKLGINNLHGFARLLREHGSGKITTHHIILSPAEISAYKGLDDPDMAQG
jgi:hypothetical protein